MIQAAARWAHSRLDALVRQALVLRPALLQPKKDRELAHAGRVVQNARVELARVLINSAPQVRNEVRCAADSAAIADLI